MTPVQKQRLKGTNASLAKRGVSVICQPGNFQGFKALIEHVDEKTKQRLQVLNADITHVLHIKREDIAAKNIDIDSVSEIERADSYQSYRVEYFRNDPQQIVVLFFCITA